MDEHLRKAALDYHRAPVAGKIAIAPTKGLVNQRDLATFEVDHDRALRMAAAIPEGVVKVAESGIRGRDDAKRLADAGYHAVLVGEALVTAPDPAAAVAALLVS